MVIVKSIYSDNDVEHLFNLESISSLAPVKPILVLKTIENVVEETVFDLVYASNLDREEFDKYFIECFPPRTEKDLSIRRMRAFDVLNLFTGGRGDENNLQQNKQWKEFEDCWMDCEMGIVRRQMRNSSANRMNQILRRCKKMDYITICNILLFDLFLSSDEESWFESCIRLGVDFKDVDSFEKSGKDLSSKLKHNKIVGININKVNFYEVYSACGFRNPPVFDFDIEQEARDLANGGMKHSWCTNFSNLVNEVVPIGGFKKKFESFSEYVKSFQWSTNGSSQLTHFEWKFNEENGKVKARKNQLSYFLEPEELIKECLNCKSQENNVLLKCELAKIRLAVGSDDYNYLLMSWLVSLMGDNPKLWDGAVLDADSDEMVKLISEIQIKLRNNWCLPWDFKSFDHQPTLEEIKIIVTRLIEVAAYGYSDVERAEILHVGDIVLKNFDNSWLNWDLEGVKGRCRIRGGLMSGIRLTSYIGTIWNLCTHHNVIRLFNQFGVKKPSLIKAKGDDAIIIYDNFWSCLLHRLILKSSGVEGSELKFSINYQLGEFLRTEITTENTYGYACRTIPSLMQRKPWSSEPFVGYGVLDAQLDALSIICRRVNKRYELYNSFFINMSSKVNKTDIRLYSIPNSLGGYQLSDWNGMWRSNFSRKSEHLIDVVRKSDWCLDLIKNEATKYGVTISSRTIELMARDNFDATIVSDDITKLRRMLRNNFNSDISKIIFSKAGRTYNQLKREQVFVQLSSEDEIRKILQTERNPWGVFSNLLEEHRFVKNIAKYDKSVINEWWSRHRVFSRSIFTLNVKTGLPRYVCEMILLDDFSFPKSRYTHPLLSGIVNILVKIHISKILYGVHWNEANFFYTVNVLHDDYDRNVSESLMHKRLLHW